MRGWWAVALACAGTAWPALRGVDPAAIESIWAGAMEIAGTDLAAPAYVDAAALHARVAPWQPEWRVAAGRIHAVSEARRAALVSNRGARRDGRQAR